MKLLEKFISAMISHALGDALGAPFEKKRMNPHINDDFIINQDSYEYTDDTMMMLIIAENIIKNKRYVPRNIAMGYLKYFLSGTLKRLGSTTRRALENLKCTGNFRISGVINRDAASNGVAMRVTPIALFFSNSSEDLLYEAIRLESYITHRNELAISGAFAVALMIKKALYEMSKEKIINYVLETLSDFGIENKIYNGIERAVGLYNDQMEYFKAVSILGNEGYIVNTVSLVTYTFLAKDSICDIILSLIKAGGDTDTHAAIGGAIAGAFYGIQTKVMELSKKLKDSQRIIELAKQLYYITISTKNKLYITNSCM